MRVKAALSRTLLCGVAAAIALAAGLAWLATEVIGGDTLKFDTDARNTIHSFATPGLTAAMIVASVIGSWYVMFPLMLAIVLGFLRFWDKQHAIVFVIAMTGANLIHDLLNMAFLL